MHSITVLWGLRVTITQWIGLTLQAFLESFLNKDVYGELVKSIGPTHRWGALQNAYVNFTHFAPCFESSGSNTFTHEGFYGNWVRHSAFFIGKQNFKAVDLIIPMAFANQNGDIGLQSMSYILISVKNKTGGAHVGSSSHKDATAKKNLSLNIMSLDFVRYGAPDHAECNINNHPPKCGNGFHWIRPTKDQPIIAFSLSMGDTERTEGLFKAEATVITKIYIRFYH
jgi:hypothetical protein